ncbi:MAG: hypothetical protein Q8Q49_05745 [bacterium]|nr:hypothetical protein [bacterium]
MSERNRRLSMKRKLRAISASHHVPDHHPISPHHRVLHHDAPNYPIRNSEGMLIFDATEAQKELLVKQRILEKMGKIVELSTALGFKPIPLSKESQPLDPSSPNQNADLTQLSKVVNLSDGHLALVGTYTIQDPEKPEKIHPEIVSLVDVEQTPEGLVIHDTFLTLHMSTTQYLGRDNQPANLDQLLTGANRLKIMQKDLIHRDLARQFTSS